LENLLSELKKNGVYANINLHVSRTFNAMDGVPDADSLREYGKAINYFDPQVLSLHKEYAQQLLTHVSPYTGKALVNDPVMAMVEITNENSLYLYWRDFGLKPFAAGGILTTRHAKMLDSLWRSFLRSKYANTSAIANAWSVGSSAANRISNASFENNPPMTGWTLEISAPANALALRDSLEKYSGKYSAKVVVTQAGGGVEWKQGGLSITNEAQYFVSFAARSDSPRQIYVGLKKEVSPWTWYGVTNISLTPEWKTYTYSVKAPETASGVVRVTFGVGGQIGTYWFDDVSITTTGVDGLLPDESLETSFVRRIDYWTCPQFTDQRVRDMSFFYLKLQNDYFAQMRGYLKDTLNVKVPIVGTNINVGPGDLAGQCGLDYVDNHVYWDLPASADPVAWHISNTPMVQSQNGGTITLSMSAVPMKGKPYTISEYNHVFPNRYQSEAPLFIMAYASFHDADGLMFFDYCMSVDDWETDMISTQFNIHRNPALLTLMPSCALAYKTGMISKAQQTLVINYAPDDYLLLPRHDRSTGWQSSLVDGTLALRYGVRMGSFTSATPFDASSLPLAPTNPYVTDTKEITWNTNGLLIVSSGRFAGATGLLSSFMSQAAGPLTIKAASGFGTLTWISLTPDSLQKASRSLLTISTRAQNTGMVWDGTTTVHDHWGTSPTQVEPLLLSLQLTMQADSIRVYPLDTCGRETRGFSTYFPSQPNAFSVVVDQSVSKTMWFGIEGFKGKGRPSFVARLPDTTIAQNQTLSFTYTAMDPNGDSLKYFLVNPPSGAVVTPAGVFSWTPSYTQQGVFSIVAVVSKTLGSFADTARSMVAVTRVNQKPVLNLQSPAAGSLTTLSRNKAQMFAVSVTDPNGDPLTYTWKLNGGVVKTGTDTSYTVSFVDPHNTPEMVRVIWSKPNGVIPDSVTWDFVITLISMDENVIPTEFALAQNFPNPFNPSTNIQFDLPKSVPVTLEVYNILGVRIRTLVRGEAMDAGRYTAAWDGRDEGGTSVSSGVYVYRIRAGDFQASKKMAILK
jgi:hypothetical protein